ncbi:MAG: ABC transporter ATP-binding protein [Chloroflexi bacterium]|nr:ABC transporter ATP-binding protein [Chloroflexota bacterium]
MPVRDPSGVGGRAGADLLLEVEGLRTVFVTGEGVVRAVDDVSFGLRPGERLGVVGESGSGKSVTALSIMRLIDPPAGRIVGGQVVYDGRDLLGLSEREMEQVRGGEIAMVFQDPMTSLNPVFTIGDQLVETIRIHRRVSPREARDIAVESLRDVQIPLPAGRLDDYPHQLSGGMRQRVALAMAIACEPRLLIADEPTTALDVTTQGQILDLMLSLSEERGTAVILISHDLGVVAGFCDTILEMYAGRVTERGSAEEIFYRPLHPYSAGLLASICRLDRARGERLASIRGAPPSLVAVPSGCPFRPRCDFARDRCEQERPELRRLEGTHAAACHFAGELPLAAGTDAPSAIPPVSA